MLLLFTPTPSGISGSSGRRILRRMEPVLVMNDDEQALQMLLDAEDADVRAALEAYGLLVRRMIG